MAFGRRVSVGGLPVAKMVLPQDLKGCENGKLPKSLLRRIAPSGQLHHYAATSWMMLRELAAEEGLDLVHVGDYRPYEQQVALFMSRMKRFPDAKRNVQVTRIFNGEKWFLHVGAPVATAGTSNHGWGLAIDAALRTKAGVVTISTKPKGAKRSGLEFLLAEAPALGWSWEVQVEPWHIRYVAGDKTPAPLKIGV